MTPCKYTKKETAGVLQHKVSYLKRVKPQKFTSAALTALIAKMCYAAAGGSAPDAGSPPKPARPAREASIACICGE